MSLYSVPDWTVHLFLDGQTRAPLICWRPADCQKCCVLNGLCPFNTQTVNLLIYTRHIAAYRGVMQNTVLIKGWLSVQAKLTAVWWCGCKPNRPWYRSSLAMSKYLKIHLSGLDKCMLREFFLLFWTKRQNLSKVINIQCSRSWALY